MRVGMVPVEPWGFVLRNLHVVIEALARLDQRVDHLILPADRRHVLVPWKWMLVAVADIAPLQALLVLVVAVCGERLIFMPAMLSLALAAAAGRSFWK